MSDWPELPYFNDPGALFECLADEPQPVLLDSGGPGSGGRWDIVAACPDPRYSLLIDSTQSGVVLHASIERWKSAIEHQLASRALATATPAGPPFRGGCIGFLSYELGRRLQALPPSPDARQPLAVVNYYPWAIVQDRIQKRSWLTSDAALSTATVNRVRALLERQVPAAEAAPFSLQERFSAPWDLPRYSEYFERVQAYISAGDCYQVNLAQPFSAPYRGSLWRAYRQLREIARAPFSAYFPMPGGDALLCLSPECFLTLDGAQVETRPIKGTRPRHRDPQRDRAAADALLRSTKERAENLMIVDLLRNDIGRFCKPGSIDVDALFSLESYATVHHLVSVVRGELASGASALDLLLGCLPGGSITGAPKLRAMQIIDDLEFAPRQLWCGSLFYLSSHGRMDSNILIRSLFSEDGKLRCWAGGGVVHDSRAAQEYQEQRDKVGAFLHSLEAG